MEYGIIGTSIWQQNMPLFERLTLDRATKAESLKKLKAELGVDELIYLSTCNRVEFVYATRRETSDSKILHRLIDVFFRGQADLSFFPNDFYHYTGKDAVTHLFRTISSLESLVVGETQITGQYKEAWQEAVESGLSGAALENLIKEALLVAKKIRRETALGTGSVSMASLAAGELKKQLEGKTDRTIALVGSGPMTTKMVKYLAEYLPSRLVFVNRTVEKAEKLAEEFGGSALSLDDFVNSPVDVDAIVSSTAANQPVFDAAFLEKLPLSQASITCIDLAIPRDFSVDFTGAEGVKLVDIPFLKSQGQGNLRQKFVEAGKANRIVREAVTRYLADQIEVSLKPIFRSSYKESCELAKRALDDLFSHRVTGLGEKDQEAVLKLVTKLIGHSSFQPVRKLSDHLVENRPDLSITDFGDSSRKAV